MQSDPAQGQQDTLRAHSQWVSRLACVRFSWASWLHHNGCDRRPHQSHRPERLQALAAQLFDVFRMCLASDSVSGDIGLSLSPCALQYKCESQCCQRPLTREGRETKEVHGERERGVISCEFSK